MPPYLKVPKTSNRRRLNKTVWQCGRRLYKTSKCVGHFHSLSQGVSSTYMYLSYCDGKRRQNPARGWLKPWQLKSCNHKMINCSIALVLPSGMNMFLPKSDVQVLTWMIITLNCHFLFYLSSWEKSEMWGSDPPVWNQMSQKLRSSAKQQTSWTIRQHLNQVGDQTGSPALPSTMSGALPCFDTPPAQNDLVVKDAADRSSRNLQTTWGHETKKNRPWDDLKAEESSYILF